MQDINNEIMETIDKEVFSDVLDENEKIIGVFRPNKKKYWAFFNWMMFWCCGVWLLLVGLSIALGSVLDPESGLVGIEKLWASLFVAGGCIVLYLILYLIARPLANMAFKKRYFAYSNKRILIRCGIIGVDYRVLDYKLLGATTVSVGILDKMLGGKTGYLRFGSASSPIMSSANGYGFFNGYVFSHIDSPYQLLKDIKKIMNENQAEK